MKTHRSKRFSLKYLSQILLLYCSVHNSQTSVSEKIYRKYWKQHGKEGKEEEMGAPMGQISLKKKRYRKYLETAKKGGKK